MKKTLYIVITALLIIFSSFLTRVPVSTGLQGKETLLKEAQLLLKIDADYLNSRVNNDWETIYSYQHPDYQKAISVEEFKFFTGHVAVNYRQDKYFHKISGAATYPPVQKIKENPVKKGFLGLPVLQGYRLIPFPRVYVKGQKIKDVSINSSGTLGKVTIILNLHEKLPPIVQSSEVIIKRNTSYIDYWEKLNGKWYIAVMKAFPETEPRISGALTKRLEYPVPHEIPKWEKAHFEKFKVDELQ